ncbi:hypothetical protein JCM19241_5984 [Vibrio ishigakensis]|uniref:Uncharacterized protein n=1 Tax=Vibrio ishigakensis TaxID=1481914 RepID=A0A0B8QQ42_9VIBR|nr:hypothetical protein JCM19241_5984 [Vibrio ishigakensis]
MKKKDPRPAPVAFRLTKEQQAKLKSLNPEQSIYLTAKQIVEKHLAEVA